MDRLPIVGVMGGRDSNHVAWAAKAGQLIARLGHSLLTGGGSGSMEAASQAFIETRTPNSLGQCIGVLPSWKDGDKIVTSKPNAFVEIAICSPLGKYAAGMDDFTFTRNHTNVLTADAIIALPGKEGTANEVFLAQCYEKPLLLFGPDEATAALCALVEPKYAQYGKQLEQPNRTDDLAKVEAFLKKNLL